MTFVLEIRVQLYIRRKLVVNAYTNDELRARTHDGLHELALKLIPVLQIAFLLIGDDVRWRFSGRGTKIKTQSSLF